LTASASASQPRRALSAGSANLQDMGDENVEVLGGGLDAWTEAGLPVDRSE
jgi:rhodanese-related sulfurtransferase